MKAHLSSMPLVFFALALFGCSTTSSHRSHIDVIERADQLSSRPEWASITKPSFEEDGKRYYLGYVEVDGSSLKSAALNMADEKAVSEPMRFMVDQFLDQNQVGEDLQSSTGQRILSSIRSTRLEMPGMKIGKRYWELVEIGNSSHPETTKLVLRAYSLAEVSQSELDEAKQRYFAKLAKNGAVKKILDEVGARQRERALSSTQGE